MIFGYFAYIMVIGLLKLFGCPPSCRGVMCTADSTQDIVISAGIIALYTGVLYGVLPSSGVVDMDGLSAEAVVNSWEVDLMGWAGGTLYAAALAIYLRKTRAFKKPVRARSSERGQQQLDSPCPGPRAGWRAGGAAALTPPRARTRPRAGPRQQGAEGEALRLGSSRRRRRGDGLHLDACLRRSAGGRLSRRPGRGQRGRECGRRQPVPRAPGAAGAGGAGADAPGA